MFSDWNLTAVTAIQRVNRATKVNRAWFPKIGSSECQNNIIMKACRTRKVDNIPLNQNGK